ncbi:MAG: PAS domain S-box protein [Chloroflexota bacterium]|nr:PAS domain S-box protein [Chloroflexota bacterium]
MRPLDESIKVTSAKPPGSKDKSRQELEEYISELECALEKAPSPVPATLTSQCESAETALQQSEKRFQQISDLSPFPICICTPSGEIEYINSQFTHTFGYTFEDIPSTDAWFEFAYLSPEHRERAKSAWEIYQSSLSNHKAAKHIFSITCKDRSIKSITVRSLRLEDETIYMVIHDITEHKQMENELRESEEKYRDLFENANDLIQSVTPDGSLLYVNRTWRETLGYSKKEIAKLSMLDIVHPDSKEHCMEMFQKVMAGEKVGVVEATFVTKQGMTIAVEGSVNCHFKNGSPFATRGIFRDITERKQSEEQLRLAEEKYRTIFENSAVAITVTDENERIVSWNKFAETLLGLSKEDLYLKPVKSLYPIKEWRKIISKNVRQRGIHHQLETKVIPNNDPKNIIDVALSLSMLKGPDGEITGSIGIMADLTERKQMEAEQESLKLAYQEQSESIAKAYLELEDTHNGLKEAEERSRTIFDTVQTGIIVIDAETHTIVDVNSVAMKICGSSREEMVGKPCQNIVCRPESGKCPVTDLGQKLENSERMLLTSGGKKVPILKTVVPVILNGRELLLESFIDITERKRAEEELAKTQRELVETARNAGMAEVATGVLHNVGNVVNSVGVTTSSVKERIRNSRMSNLAKVAAMIDEHKDDLGHFFTSDERGQKIPAYISGLALRWEDEQNKLKTDLETLSKHVQHIVEIISLQQSYSKTAGITEQVKPADIMEDALRINVGGLTRHSVEVVREFEDLPTLLLDRHQILQILTNLISNAKYSLSKSQTKTKLLTLRILQNDDKHINFVVADNGLGIAKKDVTRIFGYGFTTKKEGHGFGLHGGAITAKEMGGSLQAHSDGPGKGATFTLKLPINQKGARK